MSISKEIVFGGGYKPSLDFTVVYDKLKSRQINKLAGNGIQNLGGNFSL